MNFIDAAAQKSWDRHIAQLDREWRELWRETLNGEHPAAVLDVIGRVIRYHAEQKLILKQAAECLAPLLSHPITFRWQNGEFTALGVAASAIYGDRMTQRADELEWRTVEACYRRLVLSVADASTDAPLH